MNPDDLLYSKEHEWVRVEDDTATIGITSHAARELGEVVYVELPAVGDEFEPHDVIGSIESVKAVSEIFSPVSGKVIELNPALDDSPELVNDDPYGKGWMIQVKLRSRPESDDLMSSDEYAEFTVQDESNEE